MTPLVAPGHEPELMWLQWSKAWRIIASRYPPINLFERLTSNPAVWDVLIELEQATNPRVRDEVGNISLVPASRRVSGNNASWVMAPFTHLNPKGSRFSDGSYGVYYAAQELETAIRETVYHFERFARDSGDGPRKEDMRVLLGKINNEFEHVDSLSETIRSRILDPDCYAESQRFASARRLKNANGLSYPSVRRVGGRCVASFWPNAVGIPVQERHLQYDWNGVRVVRYFDFSLDRWESL